MAATGIPFSLSEERKPENVVRLDEKGQWMALFLWLEEAQE